MQLRVTKAQWMVLATGRNTESVKHLNSAIIGCKTADTKSLCRETNRIYSQE